MAKKVIKLTEGDLHRIVKESVNKILSEAFKSPKLDAMSKQHGGIYNGNNHGKMGELPSAWVGGYPFPLSDLTDDMVGDETIENGGGWQDDAINFKDGSYVPINRDAARQLRKDWLDNNKYRHKYSNTPYPTEPNNFYKENIKPTYFSRLRDQLKLANYVINSDKYDNRQKQVWKNFKDKIKQAMYKAKYTRLSSVYDLTKDIHPGFGDW